MIDMPSNAFAKINSPPNSLVTHLVTHNVQAVAPVRRERSLVLVTNSSKYNELQKSALLADKLHI